MRAPILSFGHLTARLAETPQERAEALRLRALAFRGDGAADDSDTFDETAHHMLVRSQGQLCATYRFHLHPDAASAARGYSGQFYDLTTLAPLGAPLLELGRFCLSPQALDPGILRIAWAALTRIVDEAGATLLFGCSSFIGATPDAHAWALAYLGAHHLGPKTFRPPPKGVDCVTLIRQEQETTVAQTDLPPLLRTYLGMGGWVSDHAVLDPDLDTLHVFTGVEIARIPPARVRALRALAN